jgi:hypothetical protein
MNLARALVQLKKPETDYPLLEISYEIIIHSTYLVAAGTP